MCRKYFVGKKPFSSCWQKSYPSTDCREIIELIADLSDQESLVWATGWSCTSKTSLPRNMMKMKKRSTYFEQIAARVSFALRALTYVRYIFTAGFNPSLNKNDFGCLRYKGGQTTFSPSYVYIIVMIYQSGGAQIWLLITDRLIFPAPSLRGGRKERGTNDNILR